MPFVRRNIKKSTPSRSNFSRRISGLAGPRALVTLLFSVSFLIGGSAIAQTPEKGTVQVSLVSTNDCSKKYDFSGTSIAIDGTRVEIKKGYAEYIQLAPGSHTVSALSEPDWPEAKMTAVRVLWLSRKQEFPVDASGNVTITLDASVFSVPSQLPGIEIVTENDCLKKTPIQEEETPKTKMVDVFVQSMQCKKESYLDYSINIDGVVVKPDLQLSTFASVRVPMKEGKHKMSIAVPDYPDAKIDYVSFISNTAVFDRGNRAYITGEFEFTLEEEFWSATALSNPTMSVYTMQDCPPSYEPPLQRIDGPPQIRLVTFKGTVFISDAGSEAEREPVKGSMIENGQLIRTQPGASVELVTSNKELIILEGGTVVQIKVEKIDGKWEIIPLQRSGRINVKHVRFNPREDGPIWKIMTPTATVTHKDTVYAVTYNEDSKDTTVAVEQGEVTITPTNTSLNPFTLADHQMVDIFEDRVSSISPYFNAADPQRSLTKESGGLFNRPLLLVGIGGAALIGLLVLGVGITFLYRRANRAPLQPAFQQASMKVEATPANFATPQHLGSLASPAVAPNVATNEWRCPNPNCGKLIPAAKMFCTACGSTRSAVKVETTPAYVASRAVATSERRCPNPQCGKLVPVPKQFCTACGTPVI